MLAATALTAPKVTHRTQAAAVWLKHQTPPVEETDLDSLRTHIDAATPDLDIPEGDVVA